MNEFSVLHDTVRISCRQFGFGEPVILIHGACCDSHFFDETARLLARHYSVTLYDRRGYGKSKCDAADYSIDCQVSDLVAIINTIHKTCHIVAHSAGCTIALQLLQDYPYMVKSVFLYEPMITDTLSSTDIANYQTINTLINKGKYNRAITLFMKNLEPSDSRARKATQYELESMGANCYHFIQHEFNVMINYQCDYQQLMQYPITIGIGEMSRKSMREQCALKLADHLHASTLYFPGGHNCPRDLPDEFATMISGYLLNI